ncbi:MAG: septum formation initiator family protein [Sediminispirochaetaceae bacterium]
MAALYTMFMIYSLELYIWGEKGLLAYQELETYKERLAGNIGSMELVHENLRGEFESLKGDTETIALYARKLGYYRDREYQVIIEQMDLPRSHYIVGELVKPYKRKTVDNQIFGIIATLFGVTAYIVLRFKEGM